MSELAAIATPMRPARRPWWRRLSRLQTLVAFLAFLLLWEAAITVFRIREYLLPAPHAIIMALFKHHQLLLRSAGYTVQSVILGYLAAVAAGVLLALPIASS